jgi:hypothetical protein
MNDALKISNVLQTNNQGTYAIDETRTLYLERTKISLNLNLKLL